MSKPAKNDATAAALKGYNAPEGARSPYLTTSTNDAAWRIGRWLEDAGEAEPFDVRPSRGDVYHANGQKFRVTYARGLSVISHEGNA